MSKRYWFSKCLTLNLMLMAGLPLIALGISVYLITWVSFRVLPSFRDLDTLIKNAVFLAEYVALLILLPLYLLDKVNKTNVLLLPISYRLNLLLVMVSSSLLGMILESLLFIARPVLMTWYSVMMLLVTAVVLPAICTSITFYAGTFLGRLLAIIVVVFGAYLCIMPILLTFGLVHFRWISDVEIFRILDFTRDKAYLSLLMLCSLCITSLLLWVWSDRIVTFKRGGVWGAVKFVPALLVLPLIYFGNTHILKYFGPEEWAQKFGYKYAYRYSEDHQCLSISRTSICFPSMGEKLYFNFQNGELKRYGRITGIMQYTPRISRDGSRFFRDWNGNLHVYCAATGKSYRYTDNSIIVPCNHGAKEYILCMTEDTVPNELSLAPVRIPEKIVRIQSTPDFIRWLDAARVRGTQLPGQHWMFWGKAPITDALDQVWLAGPDIPPRELKSISQLKRDTLEIKGQRLFESYDRKHLDHWEIDVVDARYLLANTGQGCYLIEQHSDVYHKLNEERCLWVRAGDFMLLKTIDRPTKDMPNTFTIWKYKLKPAFSPEPEAVVMDGVRFLAWPYVLDHGKLYSLAYPRDSLYQVESESKQELFVKSGMGGSCFLLYNIDRENKCTSLLGLLDVKSRVVHDIHELEDILERRTLFPVGEFRNDYFHHFSLSEDGEYLYLWTFGDEPIFVRYSLSELTAEMIDYKSVKIQW